VFAAGDTVPGTQSAIHAVAAANERLWPPMPGCAGKIWPRWRRSWTRTLPSPTYSNWQNRTLGAAGQRLAEPAPVWLKMGGPRR